MSSFFKRDYSAYSQPVVVTPDPQYAGESFFEAGAEAIHTERANPAVVTKNTSAHNSNMPNADTPELQQQQQRRQQEKENTTRLTDGIMSLLGPIVQEMDYNVVSVRKSQSELEKEIERLMAELQLFVASSAAPPEVEPAVEKLMRARRQIMAANSTLKTVQDRVSRMHLQVENRR
ncbi:hypothetical protein BGZ99_004270 [Dissophora globulifera]|uniref:Biogenesis of lysosome-related organelles complex 1 subunit 7 n=1 Tax=Dissophora globulifera TaxID=979702 RepID=A0A9P6UU28_9FUNG|nr:hypothetical protein BGZ99_004270 [Dissophora globulifera]